MADATVLRVKLLSPAEHRLVNALSPAERKTALVEAARKKLLDEGAMVDEGTLVHEVYTAKK